MPEPSFPRFGRLSEILSKTASPLPHLSTFYDSSDDVYSNGISQIALERGPGENVAFVPAPAPDVKKNKQTYPQDIVDEFGVQFKVDQVIFLTGGTGGLGGCLLYKFGIVLDVQRLYLLIRGPVSRAMERWRHNMPCQFPQIQQGISSGKIILVPGDINEEKFGIDNEMLREIETKVTIIINAAANISFRAPLAKVIEDNCLPALRLAEMSKSFTKLKHFTQVSSAFANAFLPDGPIEEKIYYLANPDTAEEELEEIQHTGTTKHFESFPWAYAYSKQLMERLITARYPNLPLLILRPTSIGPAIAQPYEMYGPQGSCPISTLYSRLMRPTGGQNIWHTSAEHPDGDNILDEIPVDLVSNILIQHIHQRTIGVIHASSSKYISKTLKWLLEQPYKYVPVEWAAKMATIKFVQDHEIEESKEARFYQVGFRAWDFCTTLSQNLKPLEGPLVFDIDKHDIDYFAKRRVELIFQEMAEKELQAKAML